MTKSESTQHANRTCTCTEAVVKSVSCHVDVVFVKKMLKTISRARSFLILYMPIANAWMFFYWVETEPLFSSNSS